MATQREERRLAAILSADVAGYSRLMGADESGTLARLKTHREEIIDPKIAVHHGRIVKLMGDGVLVEFASVVEAVQYAAEIQRAMADRNAAVADEQRIDLRIGINLGDIIVDGDDIYGDGVNVAARLQEVSEPGGTRVSGVVFNSVKGKVDLGFKDLGPQRVKNIAEPVRAYRVLPKRPPWFRDPDRVSAIVQPVVAAVVSGLAPFLFCDASGQGSLGMDHRRSVPRRGRAGPRRRLDLVVDVGQGRDLHRGPLGLRRRDEKTIPG